MNTVFKFYLQAWTLFSLSTVAFVAWIDEIPGKVGALWRWTWRASLAALLFLVLLYPVMAIPARVNNRFVPNARHTLDGLAFLEVAVLDQNGTRIPLRSDLEAIRWIRANVPGLPVIAEATTHPQLYGWGARFASHTGLPAIVGWDWHQRQQLAALPVDVVTPRMNDVKRIYTTSDPEEAWRSLRRYGAELVIVGGLERALFDPNGIEKFAAGEGTWWNRIYQNEGVVIYRVLPSVSIHEPTAAAPGR